MFAGKSSAVIAKIRRAEAIGWKTMVLTSTLDNRYAESKVMTHDKYGIAAIGVNVLKGIRERADYLSARLVIIEEAQFFSDLYDFVMEAVETDGKDVVVVGLDGDSSRKPFGQILNLVPLADEVIRLTSLCKRCGDGTAALFSCLVNGSSAIKKEQVFVGGPDMYEAMCRRHCLENSSLTS